MANWNYMNTSTANDFPDEPQKSKKLTYEEIGRVIGALVDEKNKAYGDSFKHAGKVLEVLYPSGVCPDQYQDMLYAVRVIDKLFRLATDKNAFGENPAKDIAGYSILKTGQENNNAK